MSPQLADAAANALIDAMALSMIAAAAVALLAVPLVLRRLPARHQPVRLHAVPAPALGELPGVASEAAAA